MSTGKEVFIVEAKRSPQAKAGLDLKEVDPPYLADYLVSHFLSTHKIPNTEIEEVIFGNTGNPAKYPNIGRVIALLAGLHKKTSGYTVHRNCASGLEAVAQGFLKIASGRHHLLVTGGVENMSQMPLLFSKELTETFIKVSSAKTSSAKMKALMQFRPSHLAPIIAIEQGLTDPFCGLNMGMTAEMLAREYSLTREMQDEFANESHHKAAKAQKEGHFKSEILPLIVGGAMDKILEHDIGPRENSTIEGLAKLKPFFDKKTGTVTAANSCPITDGGSAILLASEEALKKYNLRPMAKIVDYFFGGLEPERMGMGPLVAIDGVLKRTNLTLEQMDLVEINEAFAAQVLAVQKGLSHLDVAQRFGVDKVWGSVPKEKLNINGGGIALGHPVGSTGSRLVVTLVHALKRTGKKRGLATLCIGGGQGGAIIVETI